MEEPQELKELLSTSCKSKRDRRNQREFGTVKNGERVTPDVHLSKRPEKRGETRVRETLSGVNEWAKEKKKLWPLESFSSPKRTMAYLRSYHILGFSKNADVSLTSPMTGRV